MAKQPNKNQAEQVVKTFRDAEAELNDLLNDPDTRALFEQYNQLVANYNERLDEAVRAVKNELRRSDQDKLIIEGIGAQKKYRRYYDADTLAKLLPSDQADEVLVEKVIWEVNEARLEQLCRQGEVDNNLVRRAYKEEEQNPSSLPGTPKPFFIPPLPVIQ